MKVQGLIALTCVVFLCLAAGVYAQGPNSAPWAMPEPADGEIIDAALAAVPPTGGITYQGRLLSGGTPVTGTVTMTFRIYTEPSGGTAVWTETRSVSVNSGLFSVTLGTVTPLRFLAQKIYNQGWIGVTPSGASELVPRQPLSTVGYAFNVMPGATMLDNDDGTASYGTSFYVDSDNHPAIYGNSDTGTGITGYTSDVDSFGGYFRNMNTSSDASAVAGVSGGGLSTELDTGYYKGGGNFVGPNGVIGVAATSRENGYGVLGLSDGTSGMGVRGVASAATGTTYGVYGSTSSSSGYAGYFTSPGVAIRASGSGKISSTATTAFTVSPLTIAPNTGSNLHLGGFFDGTVDIIPDAAGTMWAYLPVTLPNTLFGISTKIQKVEISYDCSVASSYIDTTTIRLLANNGTYTDLAADSTNRTSTNWSTYTVTPSPSNPTFAGSIMIRFQFVFAASGSGNAITIGNIKVYLVE